MPTTAVVEKHRKRLKMVSIIHCILTRLRNVFG